MRAWVMMSLWLVSCASPFSDYCAEQTKCQGGNGEDEDACITRQEHAEERASIWDCTQTFEGLNTCTETQSTCGDIEGAESFSSGDACATENQAHADCLDAAGANDAPEDDS